jgi:hypothetical protein
VNRHLFSLAPVQSIGVTLVHELVQGESSIHQNAFAQITWLDYETVLILIFESNINIAQFTKFQSDCILIKMQKSQQMRNSAWPTLT